jgi:hypothetical protein
MGPLDTYILAGLLALASLAVVIQEWRLRREQKFRQFDEKVAWTNGKLVGREAVWIELCDRPIRRAEALAMDSAYLGEYEGGETRWTLWAYRREA